MLEKAGYHVGFTGKGWGPGNWKVSGRSRNPAGTDYQKRKLATTSPGTMQLCVRGLAGLASYDLMSVQALVFWSLVVNAPVSFVTGLLFPLACRWIEQTQGFPVSRVSPRRTKPRSRSLPIGPRDGSQWAPTSGCSPTCSTATSI